MRTRFLFVVLLAMATAASGQTIYRTITGGGKTIYSDTLAANDSTNKPSQVTIVSTGPSAASTSDVEASGNNGRPCRSDMQKYCAQSGGGKAAFDCLLDHQQEVSDACYVALKKRIESEPKNGSQAKNSGTESCKKDVQQFCTGIQPGGGRIIDCLLDHQKDISDACYDVMAKQMKNKQQ